MTPLENALILIKEFTKKPSNFWEVFLFIFEKIFNNGNNSKIIGVSKVAEEK